MQEKKTNCLFCSLGCGLKVLVQDNTAVAIEYDRDNPINHGALCPRGNYVLELLTNCDRIYRPQVKIRGDSHLTETSFENAAIFSAHKIAGFRAKYGADAIGIIASPNFLNEEISALLNFGQEVIGTSNISIDFPSEDIETLEQLNESDLMAVENLGNLDCLFIIGDVLTRSPVVSQYINKVKYGKRGNQIITLDSKKTHTSWFATNELICEPGKEAEALSQVAAVLKGGAPSNFEPQIVSAAKAFREAPKAAILIAPRSGGAENGRIAALCSEIIRLAGGEKKIIAFYNAGNSRGAYKLLSGRVKRSEEILSKIQSREIKALLTFGVDIENQYNFSIANLDFFLYSDLFLGTAARKADVILPLPSYLENSGSVISSDRNLKLEKVLDGHLSTFAEILKALTQHLGKAPKRETPPAAKIEAELAAKPVFRKIWEDDIVHSLDRHYTKHFYWAKIQ